MDGLSVNCFLHSIKGTTGREKFNWLWYATYTGVEGLTVGYGTGEDNWNSYNW